MMLNSRPIVAQNSRSYHLAENNVVVRYFDPGQASEAQMVLENGARAENELRKKYHFAAVLPVEIRLTRTTFEFCQLTGRAWWQASIYRHRVIYLQPVRVLRERGILATTVRHELMHHLIEESTKGHSPYWLQEALAIYNSGEIAFLKPARRKTQSRELEWKTLEEHLSTSKNKTDTEWLYFQLYHLGQFFEKNFPLEQMQNLFAQFVQQISFEQACLNAFTITAAELEQRWLTHWKSVAP